MRQHSKLTASKFKIECEWNCSIHNSTFHSDTARACQRVPEVLRGQVVAHAPNLLWVAQNFILNLYNLSDMMETTLSPKLSLSLCDLYGCKAWKPMRPRTRSTTCRVRQTIRCQSGTLVLWAKPFSAKKISGSHPVIYSWLDCKFLEKRSALAVRFRGVDNRTHLTLPRELPSTSNTIKSRAGFFVAPAYAFATFKTDYGNLNCTLSRVCEDPSQSRLTEVMKMWPLHYCFTLLGNTIVAGTCWISPARPLTQSL